MAFSILQSAEPSLQPQAPTTEGQEESTPKTQPEDASDSESGDPTVAPGEDALVEVMEITPSATTIATELSPEEPEASTEGPSVEGNPSGGSENGSVGSAFTPAVFDQPTGSGMQPTVSEEEEASPTAPVGKPEETQLPTENEQQNAEIQPDGDHATTECKKNACKNQPTHNCYKPKHKWSCVHDYSSLMYSGFG